MAREKFETVEKVDGVKRGLLTGGLALVAAAAIPTYSKFNESVDESYVNTEAKEVSKPPVSKVEAKKAVDSKIETSNSSYFYYYRDLEKPALENDANLAVERVAVVRLLQEHFTLTKIPDIEVRQNLESLVLGLAFAESRFDADAKSHKKAFGILQIMPATWKEHKQDEYTKDDIIDHIKVAARLMEQEYQHIVTTNKKDLDLICQNHFSGDQEKFAGCFLTPLLINAYNAGMGTLSTLISTFAKRFPDQESLVGVFDQYAKLTDMDVFIGMSHTAYNESWVKWYKEESIQYTSRVYAAYDVIITEYKKFRQSN